MGTDLSRGDRSGPSRDRGAGWAPSGTPLRRSGRSTRARLGAAAAAVLVLGGAGGFGLAHLASPEGPASSVPGQHDGFPDGDHDRGFRGPGGTPPGQAPEGSAPDDQSGTSNDGAVGGDDT